MTKVTLPEVLDTAIEGALRRARVMLPGRIESYSALTQRASVQPLVMDLIEGEDGNLIPVPLPVLSDVPVMLPGSGGTRLKFPVTPGDECELVFASASIARWKFRGGLVNPADRRHHALPDVVAHPGLQSIAGDASTLIEFTADGRILLGGLDSTQPAIRGTAFAAALDTLLGALKIYLAAIQGIVDPTNIATPVLDTAIDAFTSALAGLLSTTVMVR